MAVSVGTTNGGGSGGGVGSGSGWGAAWFCDAWLLSAAGVLEVAGWLDLLQPLMSTPASITGKIKRGRLRFIHFSPSAAVPDYDTLIFRGVNFANAMGR